MATIQRPVKTYGTRNYVAEVAAAPGNEDPILASEVDADLDTMYAAWNGGADIVNIKDGAVTNAKLATSPPAVATGNLQDSSVTNAKLATSPPAVGWPQCVAGIAVKQRQAIAMLGTGNVGAGSPVALAATPAMTIRNGATIMFVIQPIGHMQVTTGAATVRFRMRVEQSGVTVMQWDALINVPAAACPFNTTQVPLTSLYSSTGGSVTYTLFAEMQTTGGQWVLSGGTFMVAELL